MLIGTPTIIMPAIMFGVVFVRGLPAFYLSVIKCIWIFYTLVIAVVRKPYFLQCKLSLIFIYIITTSFRNGITTLINRITGIVRRITA